MDKRSFKANSWLNSLSQNNSYISREEEVYRPQISDPFTQVPPLPISALKKSKTAELPLKKYLISDWKGEELISKNALNIRNIISKLHPEAIDLFKNANTFNNSLKKAIYEEFISYAKSNTILCIELETQKEFWEHLSSPDSPNQDILNKFIHIYSFRTIIVFIFKIRFIVQLCTALKVTPTLTELMNPSSFLRKNFKKGSSSELNCDSLQLNKYSWYRPSSSQKENLPTLAFNLQNISINELLKICSESTNIDFSHSLSHKEFGLFINSLLIFAPHWLKNKNYPQSCSIKKIPEVLNCKFTGNNINSLTLSHWHAQGINLIEKANLWSELICPTFTGKKFNNGSFVKICHELQFLTFLANHYQEVDTKKMICNVMKKKYSQNKNNGCAQLPIFNNDNSKADLLYNRTLLNLTKMPKKNPHHYLLSEISSEFKSLKDDGLLYVLTGQNLFVPSQKDKLITFFKKYKLDLVINFENLAGKGNIPNYLYIITKRQNKRLKNGLFQDYANIENRDSCMSFRMSGDLSAFHKFRTLRECLDNFFHSTGKKHPSIYQKELSNSLSFEFYQDTIIKGTLLNSSTNDPSKITHPNFFKNITKSCAYLNNFFSIEQLTQATENKNKQSITSTLLGLNFYEEDQFPAILIVDFSNPIKVELELIDSSAYKAKVEEHGHAFYQYFGLIPKIQSINYDILREYFNSQIGNQIVQLTLNSGPRKIKSKLESMMVPKAFLKLDELPSHLSSNFSFFEIQIDELLTLHPKDITDRFNNSLEIAKNMGRSYPISTLNTVSLFTSRIKDIESTLDHDDKDLINYNNPLIIGDLLNIESNRIYPHNPEYFIDFKINTPSELNGPLTRVEIVLDKQPHIKLFSEEKHTLSIYSEMHCLKFLEFVLNSAMGIQISGVLQELKAPSPKHLEGVLDNFSQLKDCLRNISTVGTRFIEQSLIELISKK